MNMNISIIGTGYVGLGTGICLAELGHNVICVDRKQEIVDILSLETSLFFSSSGLISF